MKAYLAMGLAVVAMVVGTALAKDADPLAAAKCPVSGEAVTADHAVEYRDAKVYFCCDKCAAGFKKDATKHAAKANHQLVATGQYVQAKCPMSGQETKADKTVKVADVSVAFCCDNCLKKANDTKADEQVALLFADKAFEKGFKLAEKK